MLTNIYSDKNYERYIIHLYIVLNIWILLKNNKT